MSLENRYNVPKETITKMVRDGTISCSVIRQHEILDRVRRMKNENPGMSNSHIFYILGEEFGMPEKTIEKAFYTLQKKLEG